MFIYKIFLSIKKYEHSKCRLCRSWIIMKPEFDVYPMFAYNKHLYMGVIRPFIKNNRVFEMYMLRKEL
jgi:DNA-directed RNA polymerase subunit RPC12/RpoP